MNQKIQQTLGYHKIITQLCHFAGSPLGKERCSQLSPLMDLPTILLQQQETADALSRIFQKGAPSFAGVFDIRPALMRLQIGASLNCKELLQIHSVLRKAASIKAYGRNEKDGALPDCLTERFSALEPLTPLQQELERCILSEDEIADCASKELQDIRRKIQLAKQRIQEQLNQILASATQRAMLQDTLITLRNDRYCIPVRAEYRSHFPGMIHDQSSSGSTLFIEPSSVVKQNNTIKELLLEESKEIDRILATLSNLVQNETESIQQTLATLTELDFIFAKGSLAKLQNATEPDLNEAGIIHLKQARHPFLDPKKVVPMDLTLGEDFSLLIITGPNTGGKTVALKTVGLLTLMAQSGLHIPAMEHSKLAVFQEVYADIGDEQSIEQNLSTFSAHMTNIISFIEQASMDSLILFDELGAGTDPTEGAALARSILMYLHERNVRTIATTHYSELKVFALSTPGVENACCEFDVKTLQPTYRLQIGIPGKSNAFAISAKLGLPESFITVAKQQIQQSDQQLEDVFLNLEQKRLQLEKTQASLTAKQAALASQKRAFTAQSEQFFAEKNQIIEDAKKEAHRILQEAKTFADESIRNYTKWSKEANLAKQMEHQRSALRTKLSETSSPTLPKKKPRNGVKDPATLQIGQPVHVHSLAVDGTIKSLPNAKGMLFVQIGSFQSQVSLKDLSLLENKVEKKSDSFSASREKIRLSKTSSIGTSIHLLGKTVDEALSELDKYLDDAYLSHLPSVTIIHGRGTGALKNAIHPYLKRHRLVASYRLGEFSEGGAGVTIVTFRS